MFDLLAYKVSWLKRSLPNAVLMNLRSFLNQHISETCCQSSLPVGVQTALVLDLLYCIIRNKRWVSATNFPDIMINQIVSCFGLSNEHAELIVQGFIDYFLKMDSPSTDPIPANSGEFFRQVVLLKLSGREVFCRKTGFDDALYDKIDANEKVVLDELENDDNTKAHFLSDVDRQFCTAILDVCEMDPIAIDQTMLRYALEQFGISSSGLISEVHKFIKNLCQVGFSKRDAILNLGVSDDLLREAELCQISRNRLLPCNRAFECTARSFADEFWSHPEPEFFTLPDAHAIYQRSVIRQVPLHKLQDLAERIIPILDRMTPAIYIDLSEVLPSDLIIPILTSVVASSKSGWHRHFACQAMAKVDKESQVVRQTLHKVAQSDDSDLVKDTALEQLARSALSEPADDNTKT